MRFVKLPDEHISQMNAALSAERWGATAVESGMAAQKKKVENNRSVSSAMFNCGSK